MTRWLDADEQAIWRAFMESHHMFFELITRELTQESGVPHTYYEVLVRLSEAPGRRLRMSELADRSQSSRSRLSHAVRRLEDSGWVRREACPTDARGAEAVLTDKGFAALEAAAPGHVESVRRHLFDQLTPEQLKQLGEISKVLGDHLRSAGGTPGGCS
ncbi:MAG: MarR family transcriptional regulator [Actinomycetota bacterium]|nr:MarR family transcriptional regulator [Actinomycetota bacterium]